MKHMDKPKWQARNDRRRRVWLISLLVFLSIPLGIGTYFLADYLFGGDGIEVNGAVITVRSGGNFQAALDRAKPGDTIMLQAGANFVGTFVLPAKPGAEYITVTSTELAKLPPDGQRVNASNAPLMPKILSAGGGKPALMTANGAHHYRFVGVEFAPSGSDYVYNLVALGSDRQTVADVPHDLDFDRCYFHPNPKGKTRRGLALNSSATVVRNSHFAGFAYKEEETQAIAGWNGPGGFKILNNYLEGGAENIIFGGSDPSIKGLVPTDIEIRGNYMTKPAEWRNKVSIKCTLELKNARKVLISGNVIENSWDEMAVRITVRNQDNSAPWSTIEDVTMENNIVRNSGGGVNILGTDDVYPSAMMKRVKIVNNVFEGLDAQKYGSDGLFLKISAGEDITVANNTVFHSGSVIMAHGMPVRRFVFRGNIFSFNNYGFAGEGTIGKGTFDKYLPGAIASDNVVVNGRSVPRGDIYIPPGSSFAETFDNVGFMGWKQGNYRLAPNSKYKGRAGADVDKIPIVNR